MQSTNLTVTELKFEVSKYLETSTFINIFNIDNTQSTLQIPFDYIVNMVAHINKDGKEFFAVLTYCENKDKENKTLFVFEYGYKNCVAYHHNFYDGYGYLTMITWLFVNRHY